jgi:hypothetical protein
MKKFFMITVLICSIVLNGFSQNISYNWAIQGNQPGNFCNTRDIIVDQSGNTYLLVRHSEPVQFGSFTLSNNGGQDIGVVKINSSGIVQWATSAGGTNDEDAVELAIDAAGNVFVAGWFSQSATFGSVTITTDTPVGASLRHEFFVAKLTGAGQWSWAKKQTGASFSEATCLTTDASGNVIVGGTYYDADFKIGNATLPVQEILPFIVKYNGDGVFQWLKGVFCEFATSLNGIAADNMGNLFVAGNFGTIEIEEVTLQIGAITLTNTGDIDAGLTTSDLYVAAFSPTGTVLWAKNAGSILYETFAKSIVVDQAGVVYVSGTFQTDITAGSLTLSAIGVEGDQDGFILSLENDGIWQWAIKTGSEIPNTAPVLAKASDGHLYAYGSLDSDTIEFNTFQLNASAGLNSYYARLNADGSFLWGEKHPSIVSLAAEAGNKFRITGSFSGNLALGTFNLTSTGNNGTADVYATSLDYDPEIPQSIVAHNSRPEISVFPVPASTFQMLISGDEELESISMFDITGKQIYPAISISGRSAVVNFPQELCSGVYIYMLRTMSGCRQLKTLIGQ